MNAAGSGLVLPTLATTAAGRGQRLFALLTCAAFIAVTLALLPIVAEPMAPMPGFVPTYQSALIVVYALTTYLFFTQYRRTRFSSLLVLGAGSLYTTLIVFAQLLSFPNILTQGRILGSGPDTTVWLWTLWHVGPPLFILAYALLERAGGARRIARDRVIKTGWAAIVAAVLVVGLASYVVAQHVALLPKSVEGDDYRLLTTTGIGPAVVALTVVALVGLWWRTGLRSVLQLWLGVSLVLLICDNAVTLPGAARGTVGWFAGRLEALIAGVIVLAVFLREVDFLYGRAEATAVERERQRAELERAGERLAVALDAAGMGSWEFDLLHGDSRRTQRHDEIFGHAETLPVWTRETLLDHVHPEDRGAVESALAAASDPEGARRLDILGRISRAEDGAVRWIVLRGATYRDEEGRPATMAGVVMDVTEQHEAEGRLNQAQKMEAIGQLTGGVAHDFNNLLTIIVGNLDMIVRAPENRARVERLATSGLLAARRGAELTEKLLSFSRRQVLRPKTVNPNRQLMDFKPLLQRAVGETIIVTFDLDPSLDPVRLDPGQFESAILNLAVNARDAMPSGGSLTVRSSNVTLRGAALADRPDLPPGEYVLVSVADTGLGMDVATLARAFEPFFTTKDIGKGTGLGLSQVYGFVRQAGGHVRLSSELDHGTTIEIYLPRSVERAAERESESRLPLRRAAEGEVVLVVEDEPAVLDMAVESLGELGYRTLTATQASLAIDRLKSPERIDILFSDIVMPGGMNGVQLAVEARRLRPNLRVLLTSGYTGTALGEQGVPPDMLLLSKPYLRSDLADKLRLVMGRG